MKANDGDLTSDASRASLASRVMEHFLEDFPALNVHRLHRAGALLLGTVTHWQWPGLIATVRAETTRILISTTGRETWVRLLREPGTLGNDYPVFACPGCGARRYDLYLLADVVACRACLGLDYRSQHESLWSPALHRAAKLRRRLGAEPGLLAPLPPWRRGRPGRAVWTYNRLVASIQAAEAQVVAELTEMVAEVARRHRE
jgi:hypothetical protein